jgi:hypothetical protein
MVIEVFNADGQTDMKLTVVFRNFANGCKNAMPEYMIHPPVSIRSRDSSVSMVTRLPAGRL